MAISDFQKRATITISNASSTVGFQAKLSLSFLTGMKADFSDIIFTTTDGTNIPYWRESYTASTSAIFWLKLPASTTSIYIYFGNSSAATASSGADTFELFDDFSSTLDTGKWTAGRWVYENNGAYATLDGGFSAPATDSGALKFTGTRSATDTATEDGVSGTGQWGRSVRSVNSIALTNFIIEANINFTQSSSGGYANIFNSACLGVAQDKDNYLYGMVNNEGTIEFQREAGGAISDYAAASATYSSGVYRRYKFIFISENECTYSVDGTAGVRALWIALSNKYIILGFTHRAPSASVTQLVDWIFVRKHTSSTEPSFSVGSAADNPDYSGAIILNTTVKVTPAESLKEFIRPGATVKVTPAESLKDFIRPGATVKTTPAAVTHDIKISTGATVKVTPAERLKDFIRPAATVKATPAESLKEFFRPGVTVKATPAISIIDIKTLSGFPVSEVEVSRSITDALWQLSTTFIGDQIPPEFYPVNHEAEDHNEITRHLFTGIITTLETTIGSLSKLVKATAYDYAWYLSAQYVPDNGRVIALQDENWQHTAYTDWDDWINYYLTNTGIIPYRVSWGPDPPLPWKQFVFSNKTTKREAIDQISKHCDYVFEVKPRNTGTSENPVWVPCAYWVPQSLIDDPDAGLDLPAPLVLSWPDSYLVDLPRISSNPEEKINRVRIIGSDGQGNVYTATRETAAVTAGVDLAREYLEETNSLTSLAAVVAYANTMLAYFQRPAITVSMRFINRFDLELYQRIQFDSSFPLEFYSLTDGRDGIDYLRITSIKYHTGPVNNYIDVTAVYDHPIIIIQKRQRHTDPKWITEVENTVNKGIYSEAKVIVGTIDTISSDGKTAVILTEFGGYVSARVIGTDVFQIADKVLVVPDSSGEYVAKK